jgi:hypothetical protein
VLPRAPTAQNTVPVASPRAASLAGLRSAATNGATIVVASQWRAGEAGPVRLRLAAAQLPP